MDKFFDDPQRIDEHKYLLHLVQFNQAQKTDEFLTEMKDKGTPCRLTITNNAGDSLIGIAAQNNALAVVKVLLQHGAPHNQANGLGSTPIGIAKYIHRNHAMAAILENPEAFLSAQSQENKPSSLVPK